MSRPFQSNDDRQSQFAARQAARKDIREGTLWLVLGAGLIAAGFLLHRPMTLAILGASALIGGCMQLWTGIASLTDLGAEPPEPVLDVADHPVTTAPTSPAPIEPVFASRHVWLPWVLGASALLIALALLHASGGRDMPR